MFLDYVMQRVLLQSDYANSLNGVIYEMKQLFAAKGEELHCNGKDEAYCKSNRKTALVQLHCRKDFLTKLSKFRQ